MRFHIVVNPTAGRGSALPLAESIATRLRAAGSEVSCLAPAGRAAGIAHLQGLGDDDLDRLVVVGGDGTLRTVVNSRPTPLPWPLGIVPMGTANLVGRETRMPLDREADRISRRLLAAEPWQVDVIDVRRADGSTELAVANVGVGLDGKLVHEIESHRASASGGYLRWVKPIWRTLWDFEFPPLRVTVDGRKTYAAGACVVQNAYNYGGLFELSPDAALDSGTLHVVLIRASTHRDLFRILFAAMAKQANRFHDVKIVTAKHVKVECGTDVPLQADGDPAGMTDVEMALRPKALTLLRA